METYRVAFVDEFGDVQYSFFSRWYDVSNFCKMIIRDKYMILLSVISVRVLQEFRDSCDFWDFEDKYIYNESEEGEELLQI